MKFGKPSMKAYQGGNIVEQGELRDGRDCGATPKRVMV